MTSATKHEHDIRCAADRMTRDLARRVVDEPAVRAALRRGVGHRVEDPAMLPLHGFVTPYLENLHERTPQGWTATPGEAVERAFYAVAALIAAQPRRVRDRDAEDGPGSKTADEQINISQEAAGETADADGPRSEVTEVSVPEDAPKPQDDTDLSEARGRHDPEEPYGLGAALGKAVGQGLLNADTTEQRLHLLCRQSLDGVHVQLPRLLAHARVQGARADWGQLVLDLARWGGERDRVAKEWVQGFHRAIGQARRTTSENTAQINEEDSAV